MISLQQMYANTVPEREEKRIISTLDYPAPEYHEFSSFKAQDKSGGLIEVSSVVDPDPHPGPANPDSDPYRYLFQKHVKLLNYTFYQKHKTSVADP